MNYYFMFYKSRFEIDTESQNTSEVLPVNKQKRKCVQQKSKIPIISIF